MVSHFMPRTVPMDVPEFRISMMQSQEQNTQSEEAVHWPRTEPERQLWYMRQLARSSKTQATRPNRHADTTTPYQKRNEFFIPLNRGLKRYE